MKSHQEIKQHIKILKRDLQDASKPAVLKKYPHLGDPEYIKEMKNTISLHEEYLKQGELFANQDTIDG